MLKRWVHWVYNEEAGCNWGFAVSKDLALCNADEWYPEWCLFIFLGYKVLVIGREESRSYL